MELYILSNKNLEVLSVNNVSDYNLNLDEETNGTSEFILPNLQSARKGNYIVFNGLYKQFLFVIADDVIVGKGEKTITIPALDISNIFDRKIILRDKEKMQEQGIEDFIADNILENFANTDDPILNLDYIEVYVHSNTKGTVTIDDENGLYNFHTFLINCRQYKDIYTDFSIVNKKLRIDIGYRHEGEVPIDTTVAEVTDYNKVYEVDPVTKVECYVREDNSIYNLYLRTDRTTTEDKNDPERLVGRVETKSVDTLENARNEALNTIKANTYKHLVEFNIKKDSKLVDVTKLYIGRAIKIKTEDSIYDSYISAITLTDENFVRFKSGNLRVDFTDKQKQEKRIGNVGSKVDVSGGIINGSLTISKDLKNSNGLVYGEKVLYNSSAGSTSEITLSDNANNYKYIEIYTKDDNGRYNFVKVYEPEGKQVELLGCWIANDATNLKHTIVRISGNKITPIEYKDTLVYNPASSAFNVRNYISIVRVCGYN